MNKFIQTLGDKIVELVDRSNDSYLSTLAVHGGIAAFQFATANKKFNEGNKSAGLIMTAAAMQHVYLLTSKCISKARRDRVKGVQLSSETTEFLMSFNRNKEGLHAEFEKRIVGEFKGIPLVVWDDFVTLDLNVPSTSNIGAGALFEHDMIVLNSKTYEQDAETLNAILEHERGHLVLEGHEHMDHMQREYEADAYSFHQGANMLKALIKTHREMIRLNIVYGFGIPTITIKQRIVAMRKLMKA